MVGAELCTALGTEPGTEPWGLVAIAVDANAGEANESSYAGANDSSYAWKGEGDGDNKRGRMQGTTQGTDINSVDNNKELRLPKSVVEEEDNFLSL